MRKFRIFVRAFAFAVSGRIRDIEVINIVNFVLRVAIDHAQSVAAPLFEGVEMGQFGAMLRCVDAVRGRRRGFFL